MKNASTRRSMVVQSVALAAAGVVGTNAVAAAPAVYKVVFQVSDADPGKWQMTLNNVRNAQAELGQDKVQVEIVAYGPGIAMLKADSEVAARLAEASQSGTAVLACENSMRGYKLARTQMAGPVAYVASGVAHLIRRQAEGYAYIRS
jgi:intracellular sulfur oxidation DsrE/DsrF family protein